ncbi:class I SAM-dependent methyltransferase [Trichocoleus sp. FACHB-591]|nr:class I SAM-dependent methyltransferase [Trichocoleus sp. FACHB-591]
MVLQVPKNTKRLLDIGCGTGSLGKKVKQEIDCEIVGVTYSEQEARFAGRFLDQVLVHDLNDFNVQALGEFDCVVCSHILEHLYQPQLLLAQLHRSLAPNGILIVALPNVLYWKQRWKFFNGKFRYTDGGLMDKTHFRFFDWETAQELIEQSGYQVTEAKADGNFPLPFIRKFLAHSVSSLFDRTAVRIFPGLFGFQFIFCCRLKQDY